MNNNYDVYMCRNEQLINDATSIIGKGRHMMFSEKYKDVFNKLSKAGYRAEVHVNGSGIDATILGVKVSRKKPQ